MSATTLGNEAGSRRGGLTTTDESAATPPTAICADLTGAPAPEAPTSTDPSLARSLTVAAGAVVAFGLAVVGVRTVAGSTAVPAAPAATVLAATRALTYLGLVLSLGGVAFVAVAWPPGRGDRRLVRTVWLGWALVGLATVLHLAFATTATRLPLGADRIETALGARLIVLLAGVVWLSTFVPSRPVPRATGLALFVALALTVVHCGPVSVGVATSAVTVAHIGAACVWAGGLAVLAVGLLPTGATAALDAALARFARIAPVCVAALAVTGTYHALARAGSVGHLFTTTYGYTYWLKVCGVAAMVVAANSNRRYVLRHVVARPDPPTGEPGRPGPPPVQLLGLYLGAEIAFAVLVMGVTGVLVGAPAGD